MLLRVLLCLPVQLVVILITVLAPPLGPMARNMLVSGRMVKGTDKAPSLGPMVINTLVSGRMAKGTDKANLPMLVATSRRGHLER